MLVKALKSGLYAHPEPCRGVVALRQGEIMDVDDKLYNALLVDKWGGKIDVSRLTKPELIGLGAPADMTKQEMLNALGLL